jgi:radical SAM superfamily enzyme YgiQ (UPF0313 family)
MYNVIIFSDATEPASDFIYDKLPSVPLRSAGPYRIVTESRNLNLSSMVINFLFSYTKDEIEKICKKHIGEETFIVGFSTTFWYTLNKDKQELIQHIVNYARQFKKIKIIIGGTNNDSLHFINPDKIFDGYAELEYTEFLLNTTGKQNTDSFDFCNSKINYIPEDYFLNDELSVIEIARGCIFKCKFCAFPLNGKKKLDYIKDESVLKEELLKNYELFGITKYQFSDDTLNDSTDKLEMLHRITSSLPFKINFSAYIRTELLYAHREQLPLLKEIGLSSAFLGVETFNKQSGKVIGKAMDGDKMKEFLYDLKATHWGSDIKIIVALISGLPGETSQSHRETADWILDTKNNLVDRIRANPLVILNPIYNSAKYKSEFELNAAKYGFYWTNNVGEWKNLSNEVKSFDQAYELSKELTDCARATDRDTHTTNFLSLASWSKLTDNPVTFEYLSSLNRTEYKKWFNENVGNLTTHYINYYKDKTING